MQLAAPTGTTKPAPTGFETTPKITQHGLPLHTLRAGGPDATPPADVIAQAIVELPYNFGMHALIDVSMGRRLGTFDSIETARDGARKLVGNGFTSVGIVVSHPDQVTGVFEAVELLVPDLDAAPFENPDGSSPADPTLPAWNHVKPMQLEMGSDDAHGNRFIEDLVALDRWSDPTAPALLEVALGTGARLTFERTVEGRRSRFDLPSS
ncbi:MAG: hypothetical protein JWL76_2182 [Thermoleophilia bacterium]|nr:hypothetical protein [Thermoleophilia bacterium]